MHRAHLRPIERTNLVLGVAVTSACGLVWGVPGLAAGAAGALLACLNFWAIARLGRRAVERVQSGATGGQVAVLGVGLAIKMGALIALVWVAVRVLDLAVLPFSLGLSVFVVSILLGGMRLGLTAQREEA